MGIYPGIAVRVLHLFHNNSSGAVHILIYGDRYYGLTCVSQQLVCIHLILISSRDYVQFVTYKTTASLTY